MYLPISIRVLIAFLFFLSAFAKLYPSPLSLFEQKQLIQTLHFDNCFAPYFSRLMIALEIALGFAILQPHYLKNIVIPITILLLSVFTIHLALVDTSNCGCFGDLIPMTPIQAIVKNIISILLLFYLYRNVSTDSSFKNRFSNLILIYVSSALLIFMIEPIKPCYRGVVFNESSSDSTVSPFSSFVTTESFTPINIDEGEKIICLFSADCNHCVEVARELKVLSDNIEEFPHIHIIFTDEGAENIPNFISETGIVGSYQILEIEKVMNLLAFDKNYKRNTPSVVFLNNGEIIKFFYYNTPPDGGSEKFDPAQLEVLLGN